MFEIVYDGRTDGRRRMDGRMPDHEYPMAFGSGELIKYTYLVISAQTLHSYTVYSHNILE